MGKFAKILLQITAVLVIVGVVLRLLLFESWTLPESDAWLGASVAPTLGPGDTVLLLTVGEPGFGDLVRCKDPEDPSRWIVGRIVGVAGDLVETQGPTVTVNGKRYATTEACKTPTFKILHPETGTELEGTCGRVEMAGGWHFMGTLGQGKKSDDKSHTVGEGRYYLVSDNRNVHDDSRDFGAVATESCKERIVFRLWGRDGWGDSEHRMNVIR